jgi:hypothetical protein
MIRGISENVKINVSPCLAQRTKEECNALAPCQMSTPFPIRVGTTLAKVAEATRVIKTHYFD